MVVMSTNHRTDMRATHARRTRAAIRAAASLLTRERGFGAMTVDDVAALAGVSRRTVFNHFATKADMLVLGPTTPDPEAVEEFVHGTGPILEDLGTLLLSTAGTFEAQWGDYRAMREIVRDNPDLRTALHEKIIAFSDLVTQAAARRLGTTPQDPRPRVVANLAGMIHRSAIDLWCSGETPAAPHDDAAAPGSSTAAPGSGLGSAPGPGPGGGTGLGPATYPPADLGEAVAVVVVALEEVLSLTPGWLGPATAPDPDTAPATDPDTAPDPAGGARPDGPAPAAQAPAPAGTAPSVASPPTVTTGPARPARPKESA